MKDDRFDILIDNLERKLDRSLYGWEVEAIREIVDLYLAKFEKAFFYGENEKLKKEEVQRIIGKHADCWMVDDMIYKAKFRCDISQCTWNVDNKCFKDHGTCPEWYRKRSENG